MVKVKQKTIRAFEIDNTNLQECVEFLVKNSVLLKDYLIIFTSTPQEEIQTLTQELNLTYFVPNYSFKQSGHQVENVAEKSQLRVISKPTRSGEEVEHDGDLIICENIHNGAKIYVSGNLVIFGKCEGRIECGGKYLILKSIIGNPLIFAGQIFSDSMLNMINANQDILKLVVRNGDCITIKELK
ncbi:septum site-determining protein MinC [Helicobacter anatolicus]|uniref:septum site-determining protein MinC n=1 Tax=Helicobacter anatolicus TaxID=2905874 RepID=UPI001E4B0E24|nr:hypothetical protein [Helicobacter anatolicus]